MKKSVQIHQAVVAVGLICAISELRLHKPILRLTNEFINYKHILSTVITGTVLFHLLLIIHRGDLGCYGYNKCLYIYIYI